MAAEMGARMDDRRGGSSPSGSASRHPDRLAVVAGDATAGLPMGGADSERGDLVDAQEFDAFYAGSVRRLVGQLYAMIGDRAEAQDAVQEAFVRAWDRRAQLSRAENPEAWVRTVAYRLAVSRWRKARNAAVAWRRHGPPPDVDPPGVDNPALVAALRLLPEEQRRAIVLFHLCDLSVEQVGAETGAPAGTVKARLARGRAALAQHLSDPADPASDTPSDASRIPRRIPRQEAPRG